MKLFTNKLFLFKFTINSIDLALNVKIFKNKNFYKVTYD